MAILDGKALAAKIQSKIKLEVQSIVKQTGKAPGLAALRVGKNEASRIYVNRKAKACAEVGIYSRKVELPLDLSQESLMEEVERLNSDSLIHGILVQLPLPDHMATDKILEKLKVEKDVDGFHVVNAGKLILGQKGLVPCTPLGIIRLLDEHQISIEGAKAVVVGRSNIVGKPVAHLLLHRNATVTICHSRTKDLKTECQSADILIAAIGKTEMIRGDWVKRGACVIDVGINRKEDGSLVGDVQFKEAMARAKWITPVPGGVGPLTIAMLLSNTLEAAKAQMGVL